MNANKSSDIYLQVKKDVYLNDIPTESNRFNSTLRAILKSHAGQTESFNELQSEIKKVEMTISKIISYASIVDENEREFTINQNKYEKELAESEFKISSFENEKETFEQNLINRGYNIQHLVLKNREAVESKKERKYILVLRFFGIAIKFLIKWIALDGITVLIMLSMLRESFSMKEIAMRSLCIGVVLLLLESSNFNAIKNVLTNKIVTAYHYFGLLWMMFVPIIIQKVYPPVSIVSNGWQLTNTGSGMPEPNRYSVVVETLRNFSSNLPAVLSLAILIGVLAFSKINKQQNETEKIIEAEKVDPVTFELNNFDSAIKRLREHIDNLKMEQRKEEFIITNRLRIALLEVQELSHEVEIKEMGIKSLAIKIRLSINEVHEECIQYSIQMRSYLLNDTTTALIKAEFPTRYDIINYYKNQKFVV